jgi:hypothetical protein
MARTMAARAGLLPAWVRDGGVSGMIPGGGPESEASRTTREAGEQERGGEADALEQSIESIKLTPKGSGI